MKTETFEELISKLSLDEFYESNIGPDNKFIQIVDKIIDLYPEKCKILLDRYKDFGYPDEQAHGSAFLEIAVEVIEKKKDINDLSLILSYFDDSIEATDIFDCLIVQLEKYPDPEGIQEILKNTAIFIPKAYYWGGTIIARILHKPQYFKMLKDNLQLANKKELMNILDYMKHNKDTFERVESQIDEILKDLQI